MFNIANAWQADNHVMQFVAKSWQKKEWDLSVGAVYTIRSYKQCGQRFQMTWQPLICGNLIESQPLTNASLQYCICTWLIKLCVLIFFYFIFLT